VNSVNWPEAAVFIAMFAVFGVVVSMALFIRYMENMTTQSEPVTAKPKEAPKETPQKRCPVENCRIRAEHSHAEDFARRVRES